MNYLTERSKINLPKFQQTNIHTLPFSLQEVFISLDLARIEEALGAVRRIAIFDFRGDTTEQLNARLKIFAIHLQRILNVASFQNVLYAPISEPTLVVLRRRLRRNLEQLQDSNCSIDDLVNHVFGYKEAKVPWTLAPISDKNFLILEE